MDDNRYAPPKANVEGVPAEAADAPPLWNPNAAACWSLVFTPILGTWLHWTNWSALGEAERTASARLWLIASVVVTLASSLVVMGGIRAPGTLRLLNFGYLLAWYVVGARPQARWVKERLGTAYPRRGWALPLLIATGVMIVAFFAIAYVIATSGEATTPISAGR